MPKIEPQFGRTISNAAEYKEMMDYLKHTGRFAKIALAIHDLQLVAHGASVASGWYHDPKTGEVVDVNTGEKLMLITSEVAEAMEAHRKGKMDDHLPHRHGFEAELADAVIRIMDLAGLYGLDLGDAIMEKIAYNLNRPDHKPENRAKEGGKSY